jgi:hypothetical protein
MNDASIPKPPFMNEYSLFGGTIMRRHTRKLVQPKMEFLGFLGCLGIYQRTALESSSQASRAAGSRLKSVFCE